MKDFIEKLNQLVKEEETIEKNSIKLQNNNNEENNDICPICADSKKDTHLIPCDHAICRNCIYQHLFENKFCPFCRFEIKGIKEDPNFKI